MTVYDSRDQSTFASFPDTWEPIYLLTKQLTKLCPSMFIPSLLIVAIMHAHRISYVYVINVVCCITMPLASAAGPHAFKHNTQAQETKPEGSTNIMQNKT